MFICQLTPSDIERASSRKAICNDLDDLQPRRLAERDQERLQSRCADAEEDEDVHDEELVVACHDPVVKRRQGGDCVRLFRDKDCKIIS